MSCQGCECNDCHPVGDLEQERNEWKARALLAEEQTRWLTRSVHELSRDLTKRAQVFLASVKFLDEECARLEKECDEWKARALRAERASLRASCQPRVLAQPLSPKLARTELKEQSWSPVFDTASRPA